MTKQYQVVCQKQSAPLVIKVTEDEAEAQDYADQCNRGSERYMEINPNADRVYFTVEVVNE